jgi:hypothetical protein
MTYVVQRTVRGRENRAVGSPAGRENMTPAVPPPLQPIVTKELGTAVSTSIAWATNVATHTATAHGLLVGNIVRVAGANESAFNGDFRVDSVADANTFTCAVYGTGLSATGTITCRKVV